MSAEPKSSRPKWQLRGVRSISLTWFCPGTLAAGEQRLSGQVSQAGERIIQLGVASFILNELECGTVEFRLTKIHMCVEG